MPLPSSETYFLRLAEACNLSAELALLRGLERVRRLGRVGLAVVENMYEGMAEDAPYRAEYFSLKQKFWAVPYACGTLANELVIETTMVAPLQKRVRVIRRALMEAAAECGTSDSQSPERLGCSFIAAETVRSAGAVDPDGFAKALGPVGARVPKPVGNDPEGWSSFAQEVVLLTGKRWRSSVDVESSTSSVIPFTPSLNPEWVSFEDSIDKLMRILSEIGSERIDCPPVERMIGVAEVALQTFTEKRDAARRSFRRDTRPGHREAFRKSRVHA